MKKCAVALCFVLIALSLHARAIRDERDLVNEASRISYAFGMSIGGDLIEAGLDMDYAAFTEGLRDAMEQLPTRLERYEALEIVQNAFENALDRQLMEFRERETIFLMANAAREEIQVTESGLQYQVLEEGSGPRPGPHDTVLVHYEGALTNGTIFDSSYHQDEPEEIPLDFVIPGWFTTLEDLDMFKALYKTERDAWFKSV